MCANFLFAGNPSYVLWDMENCESNLNFGTNENYDEFVPFIFNSEGCTQLSMTNPTLYRQDPTDNTHSCAPGINGGTAMCINSYAGCFYKPGQLEALRFDVQVIPNPAIGEGTLSALSFHELAPEQFIYIDGVSGPNNYPTRYSLTVYRDGIEVFLQEDIQTTQEWSFEEFDFSNNPDFTVTSASTFSFELLPYCFIGNGYGVKAWDVDDIKVVSQCGDGITIAGELTTYGGAQSIDLCLNGAGGTAVSFLSTGTIAPLTTYIITDPSGNIFSLPGAGPTFDFAGAGPGVCYVYLVAHEGSLVGADIGANIANLQGCLDVSNPVIVTRNMAQSGTISIDGQTDFQFCGDPNEFTANPTVTGNQGAFNYWILTDGSNNVISINAGPPYSFAGLNGTQIIYHLSTSDNTIVPAVGTNLFSMNGCFGLSNPITISVFITSPSSISVNGATNLEVCGEQTGALPVTVTGGEGGVVYLITDPQGIILESQPTNTLDLSDITVPNCTIYVIRTAGNLGNFAIGQSVFDIVGCYSLSNPINVTKENVQASSITTNGATSVELCLSGNGPLMVDVESIGGVGANSTYIITDEQGNILDVQTGNPPFDFSNAGTGVCLLYQYYHDDVLEGAVVGGSIQTISGCFGRSNGITVRRTIVTEGTIAAPDGTGTFTFCAGTNATLSPTLSGNVGPGSQWLITDVNSNLITVQNNLPLNFSGISESVCLVYHLASQGATGLTIGQSVTNLTGCTALSNSILVDKTTVQAQTLAINGQTTISVCIGNTNAVYEVTTSGTLEGTTVLYLITDNAGNILETQSGTSFDFNSAGAGTCQIWQLVSTGAVTGATVGSNAANISGCFDLSNPITIVRESIAGGTISTGSQSLCLTSGQSTTISFSVSGGSGSQSQFVLVGSNGVIVQVSNSPTFDFASYPSGSYTVYNISSNGGLGGVATGQSFANISGCFGVSNAVTISTNQISAGTISSPMGNFIPLCVGDGVGDFINVSVTGNNGSINQWLVTDQNGFILSTPSSPQFFDFDGAGAGNCNIYHLTYDAGATGNTVGANISGLSGCFGLSNPITVVRTSVTAGTLTSAVSNVCLTGNQTTTVSFSLSGGSGSQSQYVLVGSNGVILQVSTSPAFDFGLYPAGTYVVYNISSDGGLGGVTAGQSFINISGCFGASNGVTISTNAITAGTISSSLGSTISICVGDGTADLVHVSVTGNNGSNNQYLITDQNGNILETPSSAPFDFDGAGLGTCNIYHLTYDAGTTGINIGSNIAGLNGCFGLSNPITVIRTSATAGTLTGPTSNICLSGNQATVVTYSVSGAIGALSQYVLVGSNNTILQVSNSPSFDFATYGAGTYFVYHVSSSSTVNGLIVGSSINTLTGCFGLSNAVSIVVDDITAGTLTSPQGSTVNLCNTSGSSTVSVAVSGNTGANNTFVVTDLQGNIIEITPNSTFDFSNSTLASCLIWHLTFEDGLIGATVGANANNLNGCFGLSNPITVNKSGADAGLIILDDNTYAVDICTSDNTSDLINVNLQGGTGTSAWLITDLSGNILDVPVGPPFNFNNYPNGTCQIFHLAYAGSITGAVIGSNTNNLSGCFDLSNQITVTKSSANGGVITSPQGSDIFVCVNDGDDDIVDVSLSGNFGANSQWLITDVAGTILELPSGPPFNFENAGLGTCLIWHLSYENGIGGLSVGSSAFNLTGCFDLSNSITVNRTEADAGFIRIDGHGIAASFCTNDGISDEFTVLLVGGVGETIWIVTDLDGNILDLPNSNTFDVEGSSGVCLIWNLAFSGPMSGVTIGANISGFSGCFAFSNSITITKTGTEPGEITGPNGTTYFACVSDGEPDLLEITHTGQVGPFTQCVVTDVDGFILDIPMSNKIDFEGAGTGVCYIYCITYESGLSGVSLGANIADLDGCFSISNNITVIKSSSTGGTLTTDTGETEVDLCLDNGDEFTINVVLTGNSGDNCAWVITDEDGVITDLPSGPPFVLTGSGTSSTCFIYNICYGDGLAGLDIDWPISALQGCFELSNPIEVNKNVSDAGIITTANGSNITLCTSDGIPDVVSVINSTSFGQFNEYILTDEFGNILEVQQSNTFDFEGSPLGVCNIYFVAWHGPLDGDFVGSNLDALAGCFDISNPIVVNRESIKGGSLTTDWGVTSFTICSGDGIGDPFNIIFSGNSSGYLESWLLTDATGLILDFPSGPSFDFEGLGPLTCHLYRITYAPGLSGLVIGQNKVNLDGCFGLSNPIEVNKDFVDGGALELATGGTTLTVCSDDGVADPFDFVVTDQAGSTCDLVVTNLAGDILDIVTFGNTIDFEGIGSDDCLVYNVCYTEPINNYAVGFNISKWSTCHALSNTVAVTKDCVAPENGPVSYLAYPNPASDVLNINIQAFPEGHSGYITITNMVGQIVERIAVEQDQKHIQINITDYGSGAYLIDMGTKGSREIKRFIKVQ